MTTSKPEVVAWRWRKPVVNDQGETVEVTNWVLSETPEFLPWWTNDPLVRLSDYEVLNSDYQKLQAESLELIQILAESRANDRQAMSYLNQVRKIVGGDDFPDMVQRCEQLSKYAEFGRSVLAKREPGKAYGCHCDLDEGMEPDECVIDSGEQHKCIYAKKISVKEECDYWRVIASDVSTQKEEP